MTHHDGSEEVNEYGQTKDEASPSFEAETVLFGSLGSTEDTAKVSLDDSGFKAIKTELPNQTVSSTPSSINADALADMQTYSSLQEKRKKAKRKKAIVIAVSCVAALVLLIGGGMWFVGSMTANPDDEFQTQTAFVERGLFLDEVSTSGKLTPVSSVIATPEVDGHIGEVYVSEGDTVTAGQALYTIVNDDLDKAIAQALQGINEANNGVTSAQIAVEDAYRAKQFGLDSAAAAEAAAQAARESGQEVSPVESFDVGQADSAIRQAELGLSGAYNVLANAQSTYNDAVARAAKRTVTSPLNGSVVAVNIEPGQSLASAGGSAATAPVQIADLSKMLVSVEVNEVDILKLQVDQTATLTFSAVPDLEITGTVNRIATVNTGAGNDMGGSGTVTYTVDILIENPDSRLKPGMTAKATIESKRIEDVLMVPLSAVTTLSETEGVVLVIDPENPEEIKERTVTIVASNGLSMAVEGDLEPGDELLVLGGGTPTGGAMGADTAGTSSSVTVMSVG